jgi:glutathione S-transferase
MYKLRTSAGSPFGRKVRIALAVTGLDSEVEIVNANTSDETDNLRVQNPLGKIPILLLPNGDAVYDSAVIIDYLNERDGRGILLPASGSDRARVLTQQALADGVIDAAILQVYEGRFRPETHHWPKWLEYQQEKVARSLKYAEATLSTARSGVPHAGDIAQACAIAYLDFRFKGVWRDTHPKLVAWLDDFARRVPAFDQTRPPA